MARRPRRPRLVTCTCWFHCFGGRRVWKATYDQHKIEAQRHAHIQEIKFNETHGDDRASSHDVPGVEGFNDSNENIEEKINIVDDETDDEMDDEMDDGDETNDMADDEMDDGDETNDMADDIAQAIENDIANDMADEMAGDVASDEASDLVGDVEGDPIDDIADDEGDGRSLNAIRHAFIKMQSDWGSFNCPLSCQDSIMRHLFDGLTPDDAHAKEPKFGAIFRHMAEEWRGELDEGQVVTTWKKLMKMYKNRGMVDPTRYRMCVGSNEENVHDAIILNPSAEDAYKGNDIIKCPCNPPKIKRDCHLHVETCTLYNTMKKNMIPIDYLPIANQLKNIMRSKSYCEKMLSLWKDKDRWMGKSVEDIPDSIKDFWDREKRRIYQDWWNPEREWELPVLCESRGMAHCTFLYKCAYVSCGWNEEAKKYIFECWNCLEEVSSAKKMVRCDPRNIALTAHWDGFTVSKRYNRSRWVLEVSILISETANPIELIPVLFIPTTFIPKIGSTSTVADKKIKQSMVKLLEPFIKGLHKIYYDGFNVDYPHSLMVEHFPNIPRDLNIKAMLMLVIGDHPAQCKMGMLKQSGKSACRRCKMKSELRDGCYVYGHNRK
jgi:hypothetical protein